MILQYKRVVPVYPGNNKNAVPNPEEGKHLDNAHYDIFNEMMGTYLTLIMFSERIQIAFLVSWPPPRPYLM